MKMKTYRIRKPKIVVVGGGTGLPIILKSLRDQGADITAVVTVADDGGSNGVIRESIATAPPDDLRNVSVVLSDMPQFYEDILQYHFKKGDQFLANRTTGNLIIAAVSETRGSTYEAVQLLVKMMHVDGHVYPSLETPLTLHAVSKDGTTAAGESKITIDCKTTDHVYVYNTNDKSEAKAARKVVSVIMDADVVVLDPGSLFTSILPNLVIPETGETMVNTTAETVYICNIMTQKGETEHLIDADHIRILYKHLKQPSIDMVPANTEKVSEDYMDPEIYNGYLVQVAHDFHGLRNEGCRVISTDFLELKDGGVFRDGDKVVEELPRLVFGSKYQAIYCWRKEKNRMSFVADVKKELTGLKAHREHAKAELAALLRMNDSLGIVNQQFILDIQAENAAIARRIYSLLKDHYQVRNEPLAHKKMKLEENNVYIVRLK